MPTHRSSMIAGIPDVQILAPPVQVSEQLNNQKKDDNFSECEKANVLKKFQYTSTSLGPIYICTFIGGLMERFVRTEKFDAVAEYFPTGLEYLIRNVYSVPSVAGVMLWESLLLYWQYYCSGASNARFTKKFFDILVACSTIAIIGEMIDYLVSPTIGMILVPFFSGAGAIFATGVIDKKSQELLRIPKSEEIEKMLSVEQEQERDALVKKLSTKNKKKKKAKDKGFMKIVKDIRRLFH